MASDQIIAALAQALKDRGVSLSTPDDLPYTFGTKDQVRNYLRYIGEWNGAQAAKIDGKVTDNWEEFTGAGYTLNEKEVGEDGSFVNVYGMVAPSCILYMLNSLARLIDDARESFEPAETSDGVKKLCNAAYDLHFNSKIPATPAQPSKVSVEYAIQVPIDDGKVANLHFTRELGSDEIEKYKDYVDNQL